MAQVPLGSGWAEIKGDFGWKIVAESCCIRKPSLLYISQMKAPTTKTVVINVNHIASGEAVRERREAKNKSLRWLAAQLKISPMFLSDLERGRRNWTQERFKQAMDILFEV